MYWIRTSPWGSAKVMVLVSQIAITVEAARWRLTRNAMPPMWTVPLRPMASSRSPVAPMGCADAPGAVRWCPAEGLSLLG